MDDAQNQVTWRLRLDDEQATRALARSIATIVGADDLVALSGELGAGKTTFARELIRAILNNDELQAPSPTFTLMQVYDGPGYPIVHADLFRVRSAEELVELGWDEASAGALIIVEWIERAGENLREDRLNIALSQPDTMLETMRQADIVASGAIAPRLARAKAIHEVLAAAGWSDAKREFMLGDASTRAYERLTRDGETAVLMFSPPRADGPPVREGKPYSRLARLAEDIRPFIAIDAALVEMGFSAPRMLGHAAENGVALLEDLGSAPVVDEKGPIAERYAESVRALARLHELKPAPSTRMPDGEIYQIPAYDPEAYLIEVELLPDWYAVDTPASDAASVARQTYREMWRRNLAFLDAGPKTWNLRDYHSPNIIWLAERQGVQRVGIIDFQDCVIGHPAYDVVSLLQDARVTVPDELELSLLSTYARARKAWDPDFDLAGFARAYATLGAQRATKILGIFARLDKRDMKPHYLRHVPRVESYLAKNLRHPSLVEIRAWFEANAPRILQGAPAIPGAA